LLWLAFGILRLVLESTLILSPLSGVALALGALMTVLYLLADETKRTSGALATATSVICITAMEHTLTLKQPVGADLRRLSRAAGQGVDFDPRTASKVYADLHASGCEVAANVSGAHFIEREKEGGAGALQDSIFPLGGVSNSHVVVCNEAGRWMTYKTDEHGFNNHRGSHEAPDVQIALLGDSFAEGQCVAPQLSIAGRLQKRGLTVLNLGKGGFGPLLNLATLREYVAPVEPPVVVWIHFEGNDLSANLSNELNSMLLPVYLKPSFPGYDLRARQSEVDSLLAYVYAPVRLMEDLRFFGSHDTGMLLRALGLPNIAWRITLLYRKLRYETLVSTFRQILNLAQDIVEGWGGRLYFVYLPNYYRFASPDLAYLKEIDQERNDVLQIVHELDIPLVDAYAKVFRNHPDPLRLFPFRMHGHLTARGYRRISDLLWDNLDEDFQLPP